MGECDWGQPAVFRCRNPPVSPHLVLSARQGLAEPLTGAGQGCSVSAESRAGAPAEVWKPRLHSPRSYPELRFLRPGRPCSPPAALLPPSARSAPSAENRLARRWANPWSPRPGEDILLQIKNMVKLIHTLADHDDDVNCCAFSASLLATCSLDKTIRLYCLSDFTELPHSPLKFHTYAVHCCCFSPSGHILASCSTDGTTVLWDTQNGQILAVMEQPSGSPVRVCRFSPDSSCLVSGAADGTVVLWNAQTYKLYRCGSVKDGSLVACAFSPNGNLFVTGSSCGDLTVWDDKMRCLHNEKAHDLGITCCDFSPQPVSDGEQGLQFFRLASCGQDCHMKIWMISFTHILGFELKYKSTLSGHCAPVLACAFSHNGQMLVSGSVDKSVIVYDTILRMYFTP